ncbi:hypothetical protein M9Y10_013083 [Tritrichomonas musculus]|uniref:UBR-type domain-containing protein n=1 Tax=Tritrichomonas musculus TaxID=1915356 RepID=A0ABR2I686_9EUKA
MEKFEKLTYTSSCDVPPIITLLQSIKENPNSAFFKLGTSIHFAPSINPIYTLVSLRNIIETSPLSLSTPYSDVEWIPTSSYKWLFLIVSIASRKIIDNDPELEEGKLKYVFRAFSNFLEKSDMTKRWSLPFTSGVICAALRMIDETGIVPTPKFSKGEKSNYEFFDLNLIKFYLQNSQNPSKSTAIFRFPSGGSQTNRIQFTDFPERDILLFSFPYSSSNSNFNQGNVFADQISIFQISLLKLLSKLISHDNNQCKLKPNIIPPDEIESFRQIVQALSIKPETAEYAMKALILLFDGDEQQAIQYSDNIQYENTSKLILKAYEDTNHFIDQISYNDTVTLINHLKKMSQIATEHPVIFKKFLNRHANDFVIALASILSTGYHPEFLCLSAKLLTIGEIKLSNPSVALEVFVQTDNKYLKDELEQLLIANKDQIIEPILTSLPYVADYGFRSTPFFDFLKKLLSSSIIENPKNATKLLTNLIEILKKCLYDCEHIPQIYSLISQYININGYYLERTACTCQFQEKQAKTSNVEDLSQFHKYQYNCTINRFRQPMIISSVQLSYRRKRFIINKVPKTVTVYVSDMEVSDSNQLLSTSIEWRKVCDLNFTNEQTSSKVDLKLELYATIIKYQFTSFYEETDFSKVICPRCHNRVTPSNAGICPSCRENVFECQRCRYANFTHTDYFICNECGNSNYAHIDCIITAKPHFSNTIIKNDSDCTDALKKCDQLIADSQNSIISLNSIKKQIENVLSPLNSENDKASSLTTLYKDKAYSSFKTFTEKMEHLYAIRAAINSFRGNKNEQKWAKRHQHCYNCRQIFVKNCINFLADNSNKFASIENDVSILDVLIQLLKSEMFIDTVIQALINYAMLNPNSIDCIIDKLVTSSLPDISPSSVRLLIEIQSIDDHYKYERLRKIYSIINLFLKCPNNPTSTNILKPLLIHTFTSPLLLQINTSPDRLLIVKSLSSLTSNVIDNHPKEKELKGENDNDILKNLSDLKFYLSSIINFVNDIGQLLKKNDVVNYYLIENNSNTIRSTFSEFLTNISNMNDAFYDQIFQFALSKVLQTNESEIFFCSNYEQLFSVLFELLKIKPNKAATILLNNFEFFEKLCGSFLHAISSKGTSTLTVVPIIRSNTRLLKLAEIINFILESPENFYFVIHRKTEIIKKLITAFNNIKSPFISQTEPIKFSTTFLRKLTIRSISPFIFFQPKKSTESPKTVTSSNPSDKKIVIKLDESQQITFLSNKKSKEMKELVDNLFASESYSSFFAVRDNNTNKDGKCSENQKENDKESAFDKATLFLLESLGAKNEISASIFTPPLLSPQQQQQQQQNQKSSSTNSSEVENNNNNNNNNSLPEDLLPQASITLRVGNNFYALNAIPSSYFTSISCSKYPIEMRMKDIFNNETQKSDKLNENNEKEKEKVKKDENENREAPGTSNPTDIQNYVIIDNFGVSKNARIADIWMKIWIPNHGFTPLHATVLPKLPDNSNINLIDDAGLVEIPGDLN